MLFQKRIERTTLDIYVYIRVKLLTIMEAGGLAP